MHSQLDPLFNPFLELPNITFEAFIFSGGEPHIKILSNLDSNQSVTISHRINSFNDFGLLLVAINALKRLAVKDISVFIPYFPAARQDRVMVKGEALTVKIYTEILNSMQLSNITIYDPHSDVTPALLNNCTVLDNHAFIQQVVANLPSDLYLLSPDGGALKKIYKLAAALQKYEVIECGKLRDIATGKLSGFKVGAEDLDNRPCLIVDDICDGGGTFLGLATELKKKNAGALYLAVSHGIFSKGTVVLENTFTKIYTTDSIQNKEASTKLEQITLASLI